MTTIVGVQYLRAIAAIAVVGTHTFLPFGAEGVDLFFVISGFIMFYVLDKQNSKSCIDFFLDRFFRIAPLYYLFTILFVLLGFSEVNSIYQVIQSITFIKFYETSPLLSIGWTLEYEFIFYLLCAFSIFIFDTFEKRVIFVVLVLSIMVLIIDFYIFSEKKYGHFGEFLFGILIYCFYRTKTITKKYRSLSLACICFAISWLYIANIYYAGGVTYLRFIGFGIPSAIILFSLISVEREIIKNKFLIYLGNASYAIYISHTTILEAIYLLTNVNRGDALAFDIVTFFIAIFLGCVLHSFIELRISRIIKQFRGK
jgi:exopolysaccharide production protein ExoZ